MFGSWGVERDAFAFEGGDIVGIPRFHVTDFEAEIVMVSGFFWRWSARWAWSMRAPARECVGVSVREIRRREVGSARGFFLLDQ